MPVEKGGAVSEATQKERLGWGKPFLIIKEEKMKKLKKVLALCVRSDPADVDPVWDSYGRGPGTGNCSRRV